MYTSLLLSVLSFPPFLWTTTFTVFRWHSTLLFLSSIQLWLKHYSLSKWSSIDFFLDDCKCFNFKLLQDWIPSHRTQIATCQNTKLLTQYHPLCSQPWRYLWWTPHLFRPDHLISFQIPLLSYSSISLYSPLPLFQNSLYHRHFHPSFQSWLL